MSEEIVKDPVEPVANPASPANPEPVKAADPVEPAKVEEPAKDWRQRMAGDDEKFLKQLSRFPTEEAFAKSYREAQAKIAQGIKPPEFPADGTDEEKNAWREQVGVPLSPEKYFEALSDGLVIGEDDKPIFEEFAKSAQASNMTPSQFDAVAKWYYDWTAEQQQAIVDHNSEIKAKVMDELAEKFGGQQQLKMHQTNLNNFLTYYLGEDGAKRLQSSMVGNELATNNTKLMEGLMLAANDWTPASIPTGTGNDPGKSIENRLAEISAFRKQNYDAYMKNDKMLAEERDLIDAQAKLKAR